MKKYRFASKILIAALIVCLLPILTVAQLRSPENVSIAFYGKFVDQSGQPVKGARVSAFVVISHFEQYDTETQPVALEADQNGNFALTGYTACGIDKISIQEDGYQLSPKAVINYGFGPNSNYSGSLTNPVIFRMWKKTEEEALIGSAWHGKVACDGTTNRFDLLHGSRSNDGDLEVVCTRTPLNYERTNGPSFSYTFQITLIGGSIQTTEDEFTYLAPDAGYLPSMTIERKPGDPQWRGGVDQEFYIRTAEGHYGRISVMWDAGHRPSPTILKWDCSINPSGSRNLER